MAVPFDLAPTDRLSGMHMVGTVVRRFLISYSVPPPVLARCLPPGAECSTHNNLAWISACFVRMDDMRANFLPRFAGLGFNYLIHRTRARLPFPDGKLREAVFVLEPNINRRLLSSAGSWFTGVRFRTRQIDFTEDESSWRIRMVSQKEVLYDATITKSTCSTSLPEASQFDSIKQADDFLLDVSFGGQWVDGQRILKLLPETHEPWDTNACTCVTHKNQFLDSLHVEPVQADHAMTMTQIPHYFGLTPIKTRLNGDRRES